MRRFFNDIKKDRIIMGASSFSFVILTLTIFYVLFNYKSIPPFIPIFNQLPWGNERLMPTLGIFIPIILFAFVFLFNILFSAFLYNKSNPLLARIIASVNLLLSVMNFIFIIKTIFLIS